MDRVCIVVAGIHKNRVPFFIDALGLLGAELASQPAGAKAHFEPLSIIEAETAPLQADELGWSESGPLPKRSDPEPVDDEKVATLARFLDEQYSSRLFVMKEPRGVPGIRFERGLAAAGAEPRYLIPFRKIDEFPTADGDHEVDEIQHRLLCLRQLIGGERITRGRLRVFVDYDSFLAGWRSCVVKIESTLRVRFPNKDSDARIDDLLGEARNHFEVIEPQSGMFSGWLRDIDRAYKSLANDPSDGGAMALLDRIAREMEISTRAFYMPMRMLQDQKKAADQKMMEYQKKISALKQDIWDFSHQLGESRLREADLKEVKRQMGSEVAKARRSVQDLVEQQEAESRQFAEREKSLRLSAEKYKRKFERKRGRSPKRLIRRAARNIATVFRHSTA